MLQEQFGQSDLNQSERGLLRPYCDRAWTRFQQERLPALKEQVLEQVLAAPSQITKTAAWQAATSRAKKERIVREYPSEVHPQLISPTTVDAVVEILTRGGGGDELPLA